MSHPRVTVYDVAEKLGVSHATVSLALRNSPSISARRREQVKRLAVGLQPRGIPLGAGRFGATVRADSEHPRDPGRVDSAAPDRAGLGRSGVGKFSIVRFGLSVPSPDSHLVTSDQLRAVILAVHKMAEYGYQRIGLVVPADTDRKLGGGFVGGFSSAGQSFNLPVIRNLPTEENVYLQCPEKARQLLRQWLKRHKPDALLTTLPAIPAMLQELNYRVPEDIAVAGTAVDVPVDAGIDQHSEAIGRIAVETLVAQINLNERGEPADPYRVLVESRWRDGRSLPRRKAR